MKGSIIVSILWLSFVGNLYAEVPDWNVNPADFSNSMAMVGILKFDGVSSVDENDMIAAIVDGQVRGVAHIQYEALADIRGAKSNAYLAYLTIYADQSGGEITFKLYDADNDVELEAYDTAYFAINSIIGNLENPYLWTDRKLKSNADLLSFTFPEANKVYWYDGEYDAAANEYDENDGDEDDDEDSGDHKDKKGKGHKEVISSSFEVQVNPQSDITALVAEFTVSSKATVWVNEVQQVSEVTVNDFTNPVRYEVISEDGQVSNFYEIAVYKKKGKLKIYPNPVNRTLYLLYASEYDINPIRITNSSGRVIKDRLELEEDGIWVGNIREGVYLLELKVDKKTIKLRFVKN